MIPCGCLFSPGSQEEGGRVCAGGGLGLVFATPCVWKSKGVLLLVWGGREGSIGYHEESPVGMATVGATN